VKDLQEVEGKLEDEDTPMLSFTVRVFSGKKVVP